MKDTTQSSTNQSLSQVLRYRILISRSVTPSRVATVEKVPIPPFLRPPFIPRPHICLCGSTPKISRAVYCTANAERLDSTGGGGDHSGLRSPAPSRPGALWSRTVRLGEKGSHRVAPMRRNRKRKEEEDERDFRRRMARR